MNPADGVAVVLVGIGGYGNVYLTALLEAGPTHGARLVAAVERPGAAVDARARLATARVPVFAALAEALRDRPVDLVVLATPIHRHAPDAVTALRHGACVLCEKPLAGSMFDARQMHRAAEEAGRWIGVGFQWAFTDPIRRLQATMQTREWGRPLSARGRVYWPRPESYYRRNGWAGRLRSPEGAAINDSPVSNATAHFLHALLFLLSSTPRSCATVMQVDASLWRTNDIETFDSAALHLVTSDGLPLTYCTSHVAEANLGPELEIVCEHATLRYAESAGGMWIARSGGLRAAPEEIVIDHARPESFPLSTKLWDCVAAVRSGGLPALTLEGAMAHVEIVDRLAELPVAVTPATDRVSVELADGDVQRVAPRVIHQLNEVYLRAGKGP